ncbi:TPA: helix-turn-helix transcriptional regulator [Bacillus cereus]|nr:helix-turn-helix transcriptional regulator [Bacillus cereus]
MDNVLTPFGKFCRKLRIDRNELSADMARKLDITASYLSAIENRKQNIPNNLLNKITEVYSLDEGEHNKLKLAIDESIIDLKINLGILNESDRYIVINLIRKIRNMENKKKEEIRNIIGD